MPGESKSVSLSSEDFFALNNDLSARYKTETDPEARRAILKTLFDLDKHLFRSRQIYDLEERGEYEREAYIWLYRALESYKTGNSFIQWLRNHVKWAQREVFTAATHRRLLLENLTNQEEAEEDTEGEMDALFWRKIKGLISTQQWAMVRLRMAEGLTTAEVAERVGLNHNTARKRLNEAYEVIKLELAKKPQGTPGAKVKAEAESAWLLPRDLWQRLGVSHAYGSMLLDPNIPAKKCPYIIDRRDVLPLNGKRVKFLETFSEGLVFPRLLRRKQPTEHPISP